jgi:hypothetical protein
MKIKRFKNLWTMGLILFGAILVLFYIAKIFFPEFIVGVAEIPSIVAFGNFVDSHLWAYYLYAFVIAYIGLYIYTCACANSKRLNLFGTIIILGFTVLSFVVQIFAPTIYNAYNYSCFIFIPFLYLLKCNNLTKETFISTVICFIVDIMAQSLSIFIRDIVLLSSCVNSATLTILLIDTWIWRALLYMFFNNKNQKGE